MGLYTYPNDGRVHTRYSELVKCTPGQIERVVAERFGDIPPFSSSHTAIGSIRHEMYAAEIEELGLLPSCFRKACPQYSDVKIEMFEQELKAQIFKDVVLHSTPDAVSSSSGILFDFKVTTQEAKKYAASKQVLVYAFQLLLRGIEIKEVVFLIERWNSEKTEILGYDCASKLITKEEILEVKDWLKSRTEILLSAIEARKHSSL